MANLKAHLSDNFTLGELLRSNTAERHPNLKREQDNPSQKVVNNLEYLAQTTLQPVRSTLDYPIRINSGYRSPALNAHIGGSRTSQHMSGEAADCELSPNFMTDPMTAGLRADISAKVREITGQPIRADVDANFYLFAYICLNMEALDVDQVIHEFGSGFGRPAWVHVSASTRKNKREILSIGRHTGNRYRKPTLKEALSYGT